MEHVAIDLGGRESQICVRSADGSILEERRWPTSRLGRFFEKRPRSRVVLETSSEAFRIADAASAAGHDVVVVPATLVRTLGVGSRGVKNDQKDARVLSEVSCRIELPSVHIPSQRSREIKQQCTAREALIRARTLLINTVRGWMRQVGQSLRAGKGHRFVARVRALDVVLPAFIEQVLLSIEMLDEQIAAAQAAVEALANESELCRRLMTIPGVGPITAVRFMAALDDIGRFESAHRVESYLGLVAGERASSERHQRTGITKAGPASVRRVLVQAAWTALRVRAGDPMVQWALQVAYRRGKKVAAVALARKIAGIMYALWRDGTRYEPSRGARPPDAAPISFSDLRSLRSQGAA